MKLVLAIVQDKDADTLAKEFIQNDVRATKLATSGGFLRAGNTTFIVGIEDDRVNEVLEIIKKTICLEYEHGCCRHFHAWKTSSSYCWRSDCLCITS